jgi:hypothetical protein
LTTIIQAQSAQIKYVAKSRYAKQTFTSLFFCPKSKTKKVAKKGLKNNLPGNRSNEENHNH